ncbi:Holliday junction branch migration protein RuvA [Anaerocolumna xylanovorans]|uniref:Holliday junction branch migration complex subunit RuvA n=1 Tax=Anaerocolumna xylanovorans DSM 12503 TaxID=1121345 RepID=A0A1M7YCR0_9FIRM|nr:Holliday junction branch migration protein RuvA [Anaerocolumna xylanovorans]SHO50298.1 Holliday junction DNA helicase subunit RuvA [Anaerocolumna xylanovorans DSM 12503]
MIAYVKGELILVSEEGVVVETGGLGYDIKMPLSSLSNLPRIGSTITVYTYLYVREDNIGLFGFLTKEDLSIFKLLITVNGIGPKGALGILSSITPDDLRFAVLSEDVKTIAKAPGIGTKTAGKLILELKDKLKLSDAFEERLSKNIEGGLTPRGEGNILYEVRREAIEALTALGYSAAEAAKTVGAVEIKEDMTVEDVLKLSLKNISF